MLSLRPGWVTDEEIADTRAVFGLVFGRVLTVGEAEDILAGLDGLAGALEEDQGHFATDGHGLNGYR